ncbi:MAG TPA: type II toxin-antitoxin system prevent-host-death family antitoxin [Candidatus Marinimicrobia bacterium]|nr:type II toxin-antitoxin system prevent-host-death family antitoxin [Candidatus Neomarinimicrobiota bacterium]
MKATAKDLRFHSKELLDTARRGEEVLITYRGKAYAKLVPVSGEIDLAKNPGNQLFGIWSDNSETTEVEEFVDKSRESRF